MKRVLNYLSSLVLFAGIAVSCQSNDLEDIQPSSEVTATSGQTITFKYKGETYTSTASIQNKTLVLENEDVQEIYNQIQLIPNLVSYHKTAEMIEYYDSIDELEAQKKADKEPELRAIGDRYTTWGKLTIYEGYNRSGRSWAFYIDDTNHRVYVSDLDGYYNGYIGLNKKVSSIDMEAYYKTFTGTPPSASHGDYCFVYFYTEKNYGGHVHVYDVDPFNNKLFVNFNLTTEMWIDQNDRFSSLVFVFMNHR